MTITIDQDGIIAKNGIPIGWMNPTGSEIYIRLCEEPSALPWRGKAVARFKYAKPRRRAREWVKAVCSRLDNQSIIERLKTMSPVGLQRQLTG